MYRKATRATGVCPDCGLTIAIPHLLSGHGCRPDDEDFRASRALQLEIAQYLASDVGRSRLAFAQWCREHGRA